MEQDDDTDSAGKRLDRLPPPFMAFVELFNHLSNCQNVKTITPLFSDIPHPNQGLMEPGLASNSLCNRDWP